MNILKGSTQGITMLSVFLFVNFFLNLTNIFVFTKLSFYLKCFGLYLQWKAKPNISNIADSFAKVLAITHARNSPTCMHSIFSYDSLILFSFSFRNTFPERTENGIINIHITFRTISVGLGHVLFTFIANFFFQMANLGWV